MPGLGVVEALYPVLVVGAKGAGQQGVGGVPAGLHRGGQGALVLGVGVQVRGRDVPDSHDLAFQQPYVLGEPLHRPLRGLDAVIELVGPAVDFLGRGLQAGDVVAKERSSWSKSSV